MGRKTTAQIPDENGNFGDKPSNATVVVLLLGLRTNQYVWSLRLVHLKRWRDLYMMILFTKFGVFLVYTRTKMLTYSGLSLVPLEYFILDSRKSTHTLST